MKIYDTFQFFNELDLLEIRLELLYDTVDYFVICESKKTHSGKEKKLHYLENISNFEKYKEKIIYIDIDFPDDIYQIKKYGEPLTKKELTYNKIIDIFNSEDGEWKKNPNWCREQLQREFIKLGLLGANENDIIMISDLDEIPDPQKIKWLDFSTDAKYCLLQDCHYYYINNICSTNWYGNAIVSYQYTKEKSLSSIRTERTTYQKIFNGGWHLSFMGGEERIKEKIEGYAHQEYNRKKVLINIPNSLKKNNDLFFRPSNMYKSDTEKYYFDEMKHVDIDGYYPEKMLQLIKQKFNYLIK